MTYLGNCANGPEGLRHHWLRWRDRARFRGSWLHIQLYWSILGLALIGCGTPYAVHIDDQPAMSIRSAHSVVCELLIKDGFTSEEEVNATRNQMIQQRKTLDPSLVDVLSKTCIENVDQINNCETIVYIYKRSYGIWLWIVPSPHNDAGAKATAEFIMAHFQELGRGNDIKIKAVPSLDLR